MSRLLALALTLAASLAHAQVITFGADLNRPVNYRFDCGAGPGVDAFGGLFIYPTNATNCTWIATGRAFGQAENSLVPSGIGTVTNVRIKVGPITGPMQIVVLRATRPNEVVPIPPPPIQGPPANVVCCSEIGRSAVFTPAPNAISNVAVNLPVKADIIPNPITDAFDFDILALNVLAPGVPIPVHDTGNYQDISGPTSAIYFPAIGPGQLRADTFGTVGFQLLMQADWVPAQGGVPGGGVVTLAVPVATQQQNFLLLSLVCNQATPCVGGLRIQNQGAAGGGVTLARAKKGPKTLTFAKSEFTIPPNQTQQVPAKLTRRGKRMMKKGERPSLYANIRIGSAWGNAGAISIAP